MVPKQIYIYIYIYIIYICIWQTGDHCDGFELKKKNERISSPNCTGLALMVSIIKVTWLIFFWSIWIGWVFFPHGCIEYCTVAMILSSKVPHCFNTNADNDTMTLNCTSSPYPVDIYLRTTFLCMQKGCFCSPKSWDRKLGILVRRGSCIRPVTSSVSFDSVFSPLCLDAVSLKRNLITVYIRVWSSPISHQNPQRIVCYFLLYTCFVLFIRPAFSRETSLEPEYG